MSSEDEDTDKEHDPSPQKLLQAREMGDIPRSPDVLMAAATAGFLLGLVMMGGWVVQSLGEAGMVMLDQADRLGRLISTGAAASLGGILIAFTGPVLALLMVPGMIVLAVLFATRGLIFTPDRISPRLSRISPVATAMHRFGPEGMAEFLKSAVKLGLVSVILYLFLAARLEEILATIYLAPGLSATVLGRITMDFLFILSLIAALIGGVDYLWQIRLHKRRNRMSRKEVMDELKESEGDPHVKASRRQRAQEVARNRMLADVPTADVIVVNPTHYAVALRWNKARRGAPVCVAKGVDEVARVIRARAAEHGVPIHSDPPTARALYATVELGQEIRSEHYRAVAAAIRFAEAMRKKARAR